MNAIEKLEPEWKTWLEENLVKGVPANKLAASLFDRGWIDAAYELINTNGNNIKIPYIDISGNHIQLSDKKVSLAFTCYKPYVVVINDFLNDEECQLLIDESDSKLKASRVVNPEDGSFIEHNGRTSTSTGYQRGQTDIISTIEARISEVVNWPVDHGEGLQVLRYEDGGEYRPHFDFFDPDKKSSAVVTQKGGQRVGTFLMYLSDVEAGGSTRFPNMNFEVRPKRGTALYFSNVDLNGEIDKLTLHAGLPVTAGVKYLATKWLREKPYI